MRARTPVQSGPANRNTLGISLALLGLSLMALAIFILLKPLGSSVFAVKFEEGYYPPGSEAVVQIARVAVIAATGLTAASSGLAASAVSIRPHPIVQLIGAFTMVALAPTLLLLWLDYGLAF